MKPAVGWPEVDRHGYHNTVLYLLQPAGGGNIKLGSTTRLVARNGPGRKTRAGTISQKEREILRAARHAVDASRRHLIELSL